MTVDSGQTTGSNWFDVLNTVVDGAVRYHAAGVQTAMPERVVETTSGGQVSGPNPTAGAGAGLPDIPVKYFVYGGLGLVAVVGLIKGHEVMVGVTGIHQATDSAYVGPVNVGGVNFQQGNDTENLIKLAGAALAGFLVVVLVKKVAK
ncbi:hypothetical protein [Teredinibacter turnerae]|uniref:hypothetical protein n=2 Tax=Teredinibacter turnerae TaxID=2426 RepID=UPI0030D60116